MDPSMPFLVAFEATPVVIEYSLLRNVDGVCQVNNCVDVGFIDRNLRAHFADLTKHDIPSADIWLRDYRFRGAPVAQPEHEQNIQ